MEQVAIVGGGFSGALLAINLLRHDGPRAVLIERRPEAGRGIAYSTDHPEHLLNVRAANMSAFPDAPDHFIAWLRRNHGLDSSAFVPRRLYGDYLAEMLADAVAHAPDRLHVINGDAIDIVETEAGGQVKLSDGRVVAACKVVLAIGNLAPERPAELADIAFPSGTYVDDPWRSDPGAGLGTDDQIMVLGTGLSMIDVVLSLVARGYRGRILALSRRGLLPHAHAETPATRRLERPPVGPRDLLRAVRVRAAEVPWRSAVDELRPFTQDIWRAMPIADRARCLRHLRPWWDIHRHRIAPVVADRLADLRASGRLEIRAGRIVNVTDCGGKLALSVRERGTGAIMERRISRLVNATGPQGSLARTSEPLLKTLAERGQIRADPLGIGIDVDADSRVIDDAGRPADYLRLIGPMSRGAFWEIVAVPDIRRQSWSLARRLSNAHWVEGDGL